MNEILEITPRISQAITQKASSDVLALEAEQEGMKTMREDGLGKVLDGITTIQEVFRVTE